MNYKLKDGAMGTSITKVSFFHEIFIISEQKLLTISVVNPF